MCVLIAKYFENTGWIGIKNRDRNYIPSVSFKYINHDGMDILYFIDDITQYSEGINSNGISVLSASLMVRDDEKEFQNKSISNKPSLDGARLKTALTYSNINDAVDYLIKSKLTGHTIIFDKEQCFLLEGAWIKGKYKDRVYDYNIRELSKDESIVRTNHGVLLEWAGYQYDISDSQTFSRLSSESRKNIAESIVSNSANPMEIMDSLTEQHIDDIRMNPLRKSVDDKSMMTTSQMMIAPLLNQLVYRSINGTISDVEVNGESIIKLLII